MSKVGRNFSSCQPRNALCCISFYQDQEENFGGLFYSVCYLLISFICSNWCSLVMTLGILGRRSILIKERVSIRYLSIFRGEKNNWLSARVWKTAIKSILGKMNITFKQIPQINNSHKIMPSVKKVSLLLFLHLCEQCRARMPWRQRFEWSNTFHLATTNQWEAREGVTWPVWTNEETVLLMAPEKSIYI